MLKQENKETKTNRPLIIVFVVLAGILLLIGGSIYLSRDRIQENINDTLALSREQEMKEDGILYMEAGQGADGDYYNQDGFCHGLYHSNDQGVTWIYDKEVVVTN